MLNDYHFETLDVTDYKLLIDAPLNNRAIKLLYIKLKKINKLSSIERIKIPDKAYNYVMVCINQVIKNIETQINKDNVRLLTRNVESAYFYKKDDIWILQVIITGNYIQD